MTATIPLRASAMRKISAAVAGLAIASLATTAQAAPVVIDFSDQTASYVDQVANPLSYPDAVFSSTKGMRVFSFTGSVPLDKGLCPHGTLACGGALSINFTNPVSGLAFDVLQVDDRDSVLNISGINSLGAFTRQVALTRGWNVNSLLLADLQGLTQITLDGTTDEEGVIYDNFRFETAGSLVSGVPEPAAWALMVLGFGALGSALRIRRREAGAA